MPGDVGRDGLGLDEEGRAALAAADVVIHSAATVSFDAPLDPGGRDQPARPVPSGGRHGRGRARPRTSIAVSTAYVASTHQGEAKEELLSENRFTLDVAWEDEVTSARRLRDDLEAESRKPEQLRALHQAGPRRRSAPPAIT